MIELISLPKNDSLNKMFQLLDFYQILSLKRLKL